MLVAFASIHGNTAHAAHKLAQLLEEKGAKKVSVMDLSRCDMAEAVEDAFRYSHLALAASSYDAGLFPPMETFLHKLKAKAFQNRVVALVENGSWAPYAARTMKAILEPMKNLRMVEPVVSIRSTLKPETEAQLEALADAILAAK